MGEHSKRDADGYENETNCGDFISHALLDNRGLVVLPIAFAVKRNWQFKLWATRGTYCV